MQHSSAISPKPGNGDIWTAQLAVLMCAVKALIEASQQPDEVRRVFDQLFGQLQAGLLLSGTTLLGTDLMRQFAEHLFASPEVHL